MSLLVEESTLAVHANGNGIRNGSSGSAYGIKFIPVIRQLAAPPNTIYFPITEYAEASLTRETGKPVRANQAARARQKKEGIFQYCGDRFVHSPDQQAVRNELYKHDGTGKLPHGAMFQEYLEQWSGDSREGTSVALGAVPKGSCLGHFPGNPIAMGNLITELCSHVAAAYMIIMGGEGKIKFKQGANLVPWSDVGCNLFGGRITCIQKVRPGEELAVHAITKRVNGRCTIPVFNCWVTRKGTLPIDDTNIVAACVVEGGAVHRRTGEFLFFVPNND